MPWTISHIAAVLPLRRCGSKRLSFAALALGACSPDFGYYIGQFKLADWAHTPWGLVLLCLPSSLALLSLLQFFQHELASLLPSATLRAALHAHRPHSLRSAHSVASLSLAIVLGAATHMVWDGFTHHSAWPVQHSSLLQMPFSIAGHTLYLYNILQHASTLIGAFILALAYRRWAASSAAQALALSPPHSHQANRHPAYTLAALALAALLLGWVLGCFFAADDTSGGYPFKASVVNFVLHSSAAFVGLVLAVLLFKKYRLVKS